MKNRHHDPVTPAGNRHLSQDRFIDRVRQVAAEYHVSERTARRYLNRGEFPRKEPYVCQASDGKTFELPARRTGRDGKTYPAEFPRRKGRISTPLKRDLALAYQAVMRVSRKADTDGFFLDDLVDLRRINHEVGSMLLAWEDGIKEQKE